MKMNERADPHPLTELDKSFMDDLIARHPKTAIRVNRGFGEGPDGARQFGYVPNDWDSESVVEYEFRLVP